MEAKKIKLLHPDMVHENKEINAIKINRSMVLNIEVNDRWSMESYFFFLVKLKWQVAFCFLVSWNGRWIFAVRFKMWHVVVEHDLDSNIVLGLFCIVGDGEGNRFLHYITSLADVSLICFFKFFFILIKYIVNLDSILVFML